MNAQTQSSTEARPSSDALDIRVSVMIAGWDNATADALIARGADPREVAAQFRGALAVVQ